MNIPEFYQQIITSPGSATLSVLSKDGSIQSTLVWPDYDGKFLKLNMLSGSPKEASIRREGRATILVSHRTNENLYISIRCELESIESEGALAHLDKITQRNMGVRSWYGEVEPADSESMSRRVIVYLKPVRIYHT